MISRRAEAMGPQMKKAGHDARFPSILRQMHRRYLHGRYVINQGKYSCLTGKPNIVSRRAFPADQRLISILCTYFKIIASSFLYYCSLQGEVS